MGVERERRENVEEIRIDKIYSKRIVIKVRLGMM